MKARKARAPAARSRPLVTVTLAPETSDALDAIASHSGVARGRLIDAAIMHSIACRCSACVALRDLA